MANSEPRQPAGAGPPRLEFASDHSLLATFGRGISRELHRSVAGFCRLIQAEAGHGIRNLHPAYNSVLITFDPGRISPHAILQAAGRWLARLETVELPPPRRVEVPVCYGGDLGPDLEYVAQHTGLSAHEVILLHSSVEYFVYFLGFSPGFPYLGGLPKQLAVPRLHSPRIRVPAGSVAIGADQTGIYPVVSPGGWRIIGCTPLVLFQPEANPPTLLQMGDRVLFRPIAQDEFHLIAGTV